MEEVKQPPDYPVTCPRCGVEYGPAQFGGEVGTHRPYGHNCLSRVLAQPAAPPAIEEPPPAPPEVARCHGLDLQSARCRHPPFHVGGCQPESRRAL